MSSSLKQETLTGIKWSAIERFSVQIIQFAITLVMARLLTPADYGVVGMISIFMAIAQTLIDSGFSNALIRKLDRTDDDYSTVFIFNTIVGVICYIVMFFAAPFIAKFFNIPILTNVIRVISINLFLNSLTVVQRARLIIDVNFKALAKVTVVSIIFSGTIGLLMAYKGAGVWALVFQSVTSSFVTTLLLFCSAKWFPKMNFSRTSFRSLFSFGSKMMISGLIQTIYSKLSALAIGKFYTSSDLGYYSRGEQFAALPSDTVNNVLQRVTFPIFSKLQNDDNRLIGVYRKYIKITSLIIFFLMTFLASIASPLVTILLTDKWAPASFFLQIFCFDYMFDHICRINLNLLQVKGRSDLYLRLEIIKKIIATILLIVSIPFGVIYICLSKVLYTQLAILINTHYTGKLFGLGYAVQLKDYMIYFLISLFSCMPSFFISTMNILPIYRVFISVLISFSLYYYILRKDDTMKDVLLILKSKIKR